MVSISSTKNSYIISSFMMCPARSGMMAKLVGEFSANLKYSESLSLPQNLVAKMTSLSGLAVKLGDVLLTFCWSYTI